MIYLVAFVALTLATARLTRLIYFDDLTIGFRLWIDRRFGQASFLSKMIWCPWCSSVWVSLVTCAIATNAGAYLMHWPLFASALVYPLLVPAVAYGAAWIVDKETSGSE